MNKLIFYFLIFTFVFVTGACVSKTGQFNNEDKVVFEISYLNGSRISPNEDLEILVRNATSNCIQFPLGFGIKVYAELDEKIREIPNLVTYIGNEPIRVAPKGEITSSELIYFKPDTSDLAISKPIDAYTTISGHVCDDESHVVEEKIPFTIIP